MLNEQNITLYRRERDKGIPAKYALAYVRETQRQPVHSWLADLDTKDTVTGAIGPFVVVVKVEVDEDGHHGEYDTHGMFTDERAPGNLRNTCRDWNTDYEWYQPATLASDYRAEYRRTGMSRGVAAEAAAAQVRQDMHDDAGREWFGVIASVTVDGMELAEHALWGVDTIPGYNRTPYFVGVAEQLIAGATDEARDAIPGMIATKLAEVAHLRAALGDNADTGDRHE